MVAVAQKDISPTFGRRLRQLRESAGLTQVALGQRADMLAAAVARLEAGQREPGWGTVQKLATALGVTPDAFLGDDDGQGGDQPDEPAARPSGKRK